MMSQATCNCLSHAVCHANAVDVEFALATNYSQAAHMPLCMILSCPRVYLPAVHHCQPLQRPDAERACLQTVIQTSAKMHKRALRFELLCKDKDSMIAEQEADIDSRHQAINDLQTVLAHHAHADDEQKKRIARQGETIAALQAENTKLKFEQEQTVPVSPLKPCKVHH